MLLLAKMGSDWDMQLQGALHLGIGFNYYEWKISLVRNNSIVRCTWII